MTAASYEPFGPISKITFGNGTTQTLSWTTRYFPSENKLAATGTLADYGYGEDHVGNITALTDKVNAGYDRSFAYDDLNRLTTANAGSSLWGTASGNGYTYDAMGNIKTITLGSGRKDAFTYKPGGTGSTGLPEIASVLENGGTRTVSYDAFGNETGDGKSTFTYSPRELTATDSRFISAYYYDGFRRRVSTTLSTGGDHRDSFFDPGLHLAAETNQFTAGAPSIAYKYVWLGDRPIAQVDSGGTHWTFADHLGTPLIQTSSTAAISWQGEYEPYGQMWAVRTGSTLHQPLRLPGQSSEQFDSGNNGLTERSYNNARWYRPSWGRYTQPDPARLEAAQASLYSYANDQPEIVTDPSGQGVELCLLAEVPVFGEAACATGVVTTIVGIFTVATTVSIPSSSGPATKSRADAESKTTSCRRGRCAPCNPPVGTLMYRLDRTGKNPDGHHNKEKATRTFPPGLFPIGAVGYPHHNYLQVHQNPFPDCDCFANNTKLASPGETPLDGSIPIQPVTGGGPIYY